MRSLPWYTVLLLGAHLSLSAQPAPTGATQRQEGFLQRQAALAESWVSRIQFRNAGPRVFSGRVSDLSVRPDRPSEFLIAYASGGLWHTANYGSTLTPLFDREASMTIGAIAADWASGAIWVGTGEVNASRSSYAGTGMYQSRDRGLTWSWKGLPESHHIGRILLYPGDPDQLLVAAMGHLYTSNPERGVYRTVDGGEHWEQVLSLNDRTGAIDLVRDPLDPQVVYAALWERDRRAWHFNGAGEGSGIYRSSDGGACWTLISPSDSGFPSGKDCGRIGLAIGLRDGVPTLLALVDNLGADTTKAAPEQKGLVASDFRDMSPETLLLLDEEKLEDFLRKKGFPKKYDAVSVKEIVRSGQIPVRALYDYLDDANARLFNTPVIGAELYCLERDGRTWTRTHDGPISDLYYSYGYYFGQIRVAPDNADDLYLLGVPILRSSDGGKTFRNVNRENVHVDHHALWINPNDPSHLLLGNDGGVNLSYDSGESWTRINRAPVGQFYSVAVDMAEPFNIYGGLQDNGVWKGPSDYSMSEAWEMSGRYPYENLIGGDGMQVCIDPRDGGRTVYTGYQFGHYFRLDTRSGERVSITPKPELGDRPYRWNWQTPIHLSVHQPDILYMGCHRLLRSLDRGEHFAPISTDLTKGGREGNVPYGTLTAIHESPLRFGLLYTGSDDGLVHLSRDGGFQWEALQGGWPEGMWVSRIQASQHSESRVWLALNGYRDDHFEAWLFRSDDYGQTWLRIGTDLPAEPVNVIREDPVHPTLIYAGTDGGVYASLNLGEKFMPFDESLPHVPVHDLVVHPRDGKLVLGTHGRSFYIADVHRLQQLRDSVLKKGFHLFPLADQQYREDPTAGWNRWIPAVPPVLTVWLFNDRPARLRWKVKAEGNELVLAEGGLDLSPGLNHWDWDLTCKDEQTMKRWRSGRDKKASAPHLPQAANGRYYLPPGTYRLEVDAGDGRTTDRPVVIR
jgi:photosystem II stability/assembly factor-like uncharacterized protein